MAEKNQNFEMYAGDSKEIIVKVTENGQPVDLSGAVIKWAMKQSLNAPAHAVFKETGEGVVITNAEQGTFSIFLAPEDTETLIGGGQTSFTSIGGGSSNNFYHEAEITDAGGNVSTVLVGSIKMMPSGVGKGERK